jgi:hypothetical protein
MDHGRTARAVWIRLPCGDIFGDDAFGRNFDFIVAELGVGQIARAHEISKVQRLLFDRKDRAIPQKPVRHGEAFPERPR